MMEQLRENWKVATLVAIGLTILFAANAHLVFVAFGSQPDCVAHDKVIDDTKTTFRAAKSSC